MLKVLTIIGTRPEAIKLAPVILELEKYPETFRSVICVTAQHREMLDQVLKLFDIVPDIDLDLMQPDQDLHTLTSRVIVRVGEVLAEQAPDVLLIQGDTTTVMAGALAAFYHNVPIAHVEAGLRTSTLYSPFPEEMNRRFTSMLASYHFAPTDRAKEALLREGVSAGRIHVTGNTVIDALFMILDKPRPNEVDTILRSAGLSTDSRKLILVTAHRREHFGRKFQELCQGLKALAERNPDIAIVYPVHMNPNVRKPVFQILQGTSNVKLIDPIQYDEMAHLMAASYLLITDSGGIQEEASALGKPVLVMRSETERPEGVEAGIAKLIGPSKDRIVEEAERLIRNGTAYEQMSRKLNLYGDGHAAERIVKIMRDIEQGRADS